MFTILPLYTCPQGGGSMFKFSIIGIFVFFLMISVANAGKAQTERAFVLKENTEKVGKWVESHRAEIKKAGGCVIIEYKNDRMRISKNTIKGKMEWTEKLEQEQGDNGWLFISKLVEVHQGNIVDNLSQLYVISEPTGCSITIQISSEVDGATVSQVKREIDRSAAKIQELFEKNFDH